MEFSPEAERILYTTRSSFHTTHRPYLIGGIGLDGIVGKRLLVRGLLVKGLFGSIIPNIPFLFVHGIEQWTRLILCVLCLF